MTGIHPRASPGHAPCGALRDKSRGIYPAVAEKMPFAELSKF